MIECLPAWTLFGRDRIREYEDAIERAMMIKADDAIHSAHQSQGLEGHNKTDKNIANSAYQRPSGENLTAKALRRKVPPGAKHAHTKP